MIKWQLRAQVAQACWQVLQKKRMLDEVLSQIEVLCPPSDLSLLKELSYGTLRFLPKLQVLLSYLLDKPLKQKDFIVELLLCVGLYELGHLGTKPYAVVNECVKALPALNKKWAKGLLNALLRRYCREQNALELRLTQDKMAGLAHPTWWVESLKFDWPDDYLAILNANNQRPPMTLRVNRQFISRDCYQQKLIEAGIDATSSSVAEDALLLAKPTSVISLPGFAEGECSVQDLAAQLAAPLLACEPGDNVLDACAAPGGKTTHILGLTPDIASLTAVDQNNARLHRMQENLTRLNQQCDIIAQDVLAYAKDCGKQFDKILLDAPCSASGIVRRHVDIKYLRSPADIDELAELQLVLLQAMWAILKPGGKLLYATCSIFKKENSDNIARFLAISDAAKELALPEHWGRAQPHGRQIITGQEHMDGFYYAWLQKS